MIMHMRSWHGNGMRHAACNVIVELVSFCGLHLMHMLRMLPGVKCTNGRAGT